jgi:lipoprotein-anchoring transpeptidase ErfK/SrfK
LALVACIGFATGEAAAQYYPSHPRAASPQPYGAAPAPYEDDEDEAPTSTLPPPGPYRSSVQPYETRPLPPPGERQALPQPAPEGYYPPQYPSGDRQAMPQPAPERYYPPQYPSGERHALPQRAPEPYYPSQSGYPSQSARPSPFFRSYDDNASLPPSGRQPIEEGIQVVRPPVDVSGRQGPIDLAPTGAPMQQGSLPQDGRTRVAALPPEDQPEDGPAKELPPQFKRQHVDFATKEPAGTIVIDTAKTYLYLVLGGGKAMRYGVGVGREGFTWAGAERVSRMTEWPDWHPPKEMIERQPYLPRFMAGGAGNPMGARALYLGKTLYRIHGTNQPSTIGQFVSSGCIRLLNDDIEDLYSRVQVGTRVVVMPGRPPANVSNVPPSAQMAPGAPVPITR